MYKNYIKRILDFTVAFVVLACVSPILVLTCVLLYFTNKGAGVFFLQPRPGKDGKIFRIIKFKTMTDERDASGELLPDEQRLTRIGRMMRATSLDEFPQLINVLMGDMSLVGPRPLLVHYLPWYTPEQAHRHDLRPGITGWAQVNGRNMCKLSQKFEYDVWYVNHCSLALDMKIMRITVHNVLHHKDIGHGTANMAQVDDLGFHERYLQLVASQNNAKR